MYSTWTTCQYLERVQNPRLDCSIYFILKDTSGYTFTCYFWQINVQKSTHLMKKLTMLPNLTQFFFYWINHYVAKCLNTTAIKYSYFTIHSLICPSYMYNNFYYFQFTSLNCSFLLLFAAFGRLISGVTLTYIIGRCAASTNQVCALHCTVL